MSASGPSLGASAPRPFGWAVRCLLFGGCGGILLLGSPEPAEAQQLGTRCDFPEQYRSIESRTPIPGRRVTFIGAPVLRCPDGVRIRADSAVVYEETGRNELIGNVRFTSPDRTLLGALVDYYEREGRLFARGNVHFTEAERGIELTGDTLIYLEITPTRPEEQVSVFGGRPRAIIPGPGGGDAPYVVVSDRIQIEGERFFWAYGDVEVERDSLEAASDTLAFDQTDDRLILTGSAWMRQGATRAEGGVLNVNFVDEAIQEVQALRDGRLLDGEMDLSGWEVVVTMGEDETPRHVVASSGGPEGEEPRMAEARTEELFLRSETIEIELPDGVLQYLVATGEALAETTRGELVEIDSAAVAEGYPDRDWVRAEVITISFVPVEAAEIVSPDGPAEPPELEGEGDGGRQYLVDGIEAEGSARALYRTAPEGEEGPIPIRLWSISYILADRIMIVMHDGEVQELQAFGQVDGLQLEPTGTAERAPGDAPPGGGEEE